MERGRCPLSHDVFHGSKLGPEPCLQPIQGPDLSPVLPPHGDLAQVNRNVIIADRAVTAMRRIVNHLQGASLIGAEKAKDEMLARISSLGRNATPADARKARFDTLPGDIRSILAHNHRIYYLIEDNRIVVLDVILDAEVHSKESE